MSVRAFDGSGSGRSFSARNAFAARPRAGSDAKPALSDEALIASIAGGDELALGQLYERFGAVAYGLALRVVRDPSLAEEAVQDAFLSAWRSASRFDVERGSVRTWLLTLVHHRAVDLLKRAARRREETNEELPANGVPSTAETADLRAEQRRVRTALSYLPARQRRAIELAYYGGYSQSQIAEFLSLPLGTIKSQTFAGLSRLRDLLCERDEPLDGLHAVSSPDR